MTMRLESGALEPLRQVLGLVGAGAQITEMPDGLLNQELDVLPFIRRGLLREPSLGEFTFTMQNVHGAGGTITSQQNLFNLGPAITGWIPNFPGGAPWPRDRYDLWLLYAQAVTTAGGGAFTSSVLSYLPPSALNAVGPVAPGDLMVKGANAEQAAGATIWHTLSNGAFLGLQLRLPFRMHPDSTLQFQSISTGAATYTLTGLLGLFPAGLGQDAVS